MSNTTRDNGISAKKKLLWGFFIIIFIICVVIVITLVDLNRATNDEKDRHITGNYARIEAMLKDFDSVVDRTMVNTRVLSSSLYLTPLFATADRDTLKAEFGMEGQDAADTKQESLMQWHRSLIQEETDYCVSIRYSPASGYYLGASTDEPNGFLVPDFASLYQRIHLSGQVSEPDLLLPGSYHLCVLDTAASHVLLYTTVHEESGTILIYGFRPSVLDSTVFSANIGPSYEYVSTHLVLPDGQSLFSPADGEDTLSSSDLRKILSREDLTFDSNGKTFMKIRERNGGFSLVYELVEIRSGPIDHGMYTTLLICLALFLLVLVAMAVFVLRLLYRPLQNLADSINALPQSDQKEGPDDPFARISSALDYYRQQASLSQMTIEQQNDMLYRSILLKLMLDPAYISSEEETAYFKLDQQLSSFALMSVEATNEEWSPEKMDHLERVYHRNLALLDAENEIGNQYMNYSPVCLRHERQTFVVFRVNEEELSLLHNVLMNTLVFLNQQMKATYVFRFSKIHTTPSELWSAYQEVMYHPDFSLSADRESVPRGNINMQQTLQLENRLISLIYIESYEKAYECLSEIIRLIFDGEENAAMRKNQVESISIRTFRMLMESNPENQIRLDALLVEYGQMNEHTLFSELDFWKKVFEELQSNTESHVKTSSEDFNAILQYIQLHYKDPNLSLTSISDVFHRPIASLSRDFQKYEGKGFLEILHSLRLDAAEKEIATTQNSMKDIAEHVGYTNEITMTRAFKKYRGVTPGIYRAKKDRKET